MAQIQICGMSLKRTGDSNYSLVELQDRVTVPSIGDFIEVRLNNKEPVRGRVAQIASSPLGKLSSQYGISYVDLDEVINFD
jgi:hypothetical protein